MCIRDSDSTPLSIGTSLLLPQPMCLGHVVTLPPSEQVVLVEKSDHDGNTIILTLPTLLLWDSKEDNIVFCSALHVHCILFVLLLLLCQFTYLTRHGGDSGPERLQVCREIVESSTK